MGPGALDFCGTPACIRSFGRSTCAPDMGNRKISVPPADDQSGEPPPLPPPATADPYSREYLSAAVTLVMLTPVVAMCATGLHLVKGRLIDCSGRRAQSSFVQIRLSAWSESG